MEELYSLSKGSHCTVNQVLYHLGSRGIEYDLLLWQREHKMPIMAYSPLAQAGRSKIVRAACSHLISQDLRFNDAIENEHRYSNIIINIDIRK